MKPKELIYIFILIVIIYFIYIYFIEQKESFIGQINESFRPHYRNVKTVFNDSCNSLVSSSKRIIRKMGIY